MGKMAVDVVLVPSREVLDLCVRVSRELKSEILLGDGCVPHVSLLMGVLDDSSVGTVEKIMESVASESDPLALEITGTNTKTAENGKTLFEFLIKNTNELQNLHERAAELLGPHLADEPSKEMFFSPPEVNDLTVSWVREYSASSGVDYSPHITLGFGKTNVGQIPTEFEARTLSLYHIGNYCTCRKFLASMEL